MELVGAKIIFDRSFLGDGESKSYVFVRSIYPGVDVNKLECVGRVQMVAQSQEKCKESWRKGKTAEKIIDRLKNYYDIAVRGNEGNLQAMKKAIHTTLFYVASLKTTIWLTGRVRS